MILHRTELINILFDFAETNRNTFYDDLVGLGESVLQSDLAHEEHMRIPGHARPIVIPVEQVESWWLFP
jgi:hypothetical protein